MAGYFGLDRIEPIETGVEFGGVMVGKIPRQRVRRVPAPDRQVLARLEAGRNRGPHSEETNDAALPRSKASRLYFAARGFVVAIETNPFVKLFVGLVFLVTAFALIQDLRDRQTARLTNAWTLYQSTAPNTPAHNGAIENLHRLGVSFAGIDWSCRAVGEFVAAETEHDDGTCIEQPAFRYLDLAPVAKAGSIWPIYMSYRPVILTGADLADSTFDFADLTGAELTNANLMASSFVSANLMAARLVDASVGDANMAFVDASSANFASADLGGTTWLGAKLVGANLVNASLRDIHLEEANLSSAVFCGNVLGTTNCASGLTQQQLDEAWAWADRPPVGLEDLNPPLVLKNACNPKLRGGYEDAREAGMPEGC